jgi:AcrR family transcriptional regulator
MKKTVQPTANEDLTAKARIRNAAFELYAAKGEANTSVREVAQAAGVTHGLVVHHFVNKEGLHRAVQQHVVDLLRHALNSVPTDGTPAEIGKARDASVARMYSENPTYLRYIRRQLLDPASVDHELLDVLAEFTLTQVRDLRAAGVASVDTPEPIQVFAVLMRELAPRLLEPLMQRLWRHLAGKSAGAPPEIEIRIKRNARR